MKFVRVSANTFRERFINIDAICDAHCSRDHPKGDDLTLIIYFGDTFATTLKNEEARVVLSAIKANAEETQ